MLLKNAIIRAGSITFRRRLTHDLLAVPDFENNTDRIHLSKAPETVTGVTLFMEGSLMSLGNTIGSLYVTVPSEQRDPLDTVIKLD